MTLDTIENKGRPAEVLLVEDNPGDVILTKKAFANAKFASNLHVAKDGEQALAMLKREPPYNTMAVPDIVLLDLNLPKKNGGDVLKEIKADDKLKHIPIIVLTSSSAEMDVVKSYNFHANGYIVKPLASQKLGEIITNIQQFWFRTIILPN